MDTVFKALSDPSRRILLDALFAEDGQSLIELQAHLPMSRFGVMKHLQLLEQAGLVTTAKIGREKRHYLNPVPIQLVYDRLVSKYAGTWAGAMTRLKYDLEEEPTTMQTMTEPAVQTRTHVYAILIRTTPERLWAALTDPEQSRQYYFGTRVESTWEAGAPYRYVRPDGEAMIRGEVLERDPPRRLVTTFVPGWSASPDPAASTVTFEIEPMGEACTLRLTHADLIVDDPDTAGVDIGWSQIFSSLKTLLETGTPLTLSDPVAPA